MQQERRRPGRARRQTSPDAGRRHTEAPGPLPGQQRSHPQSQACRKAEVSSQRSICRLLSTRSANIQRISALPTGINATSTMPFQCRTPVTRPAGITRARSAQRIRAGLVAGSVRGGCEADERGEEASASGATQTVANLVLMYIDFSRETADAPMASKQSRDENNEEKPVRRLAACAANRWFS